MKGNIMAENWLYAIWILLFILSFPLAFNLIPPNRVYGFRTASTLSSPDIWAKANIFAGWAFMLSALAGAAVTYFIPEAAESLGVFLAVIFVAIPVLLSFLFLKRFVK